MVWTVLMPHWEVAAAQPPVQALCPYSHFCSSRGGGGDHSYCLCTPPHPTGGCSGPRGTHPVSVAPQGADQDPSPSFSMREDTRWYLPQAAASVCHRGAGPRSEAGTPGAPPCPATLAPGKQHLPSVSCVLEEAPLAALGERGRQAEVTAAGRRGPGRDLAERRR